MRSWQVQKAKGPFSPAGTWDRGLFQGIGAGLRKRTQRPAGLRACPLAGVSVGAHEHLDRVLAEARAFHEAGRGA